MAKTRKLSAGLKAWTAHWKKVREEMKRKGTFKKGDNLTKVFREAKKTFKHHKRGGADEPSSDDEKKPASVDVPDMPTEEPGSEGGRRRKRTRRHRRR